MADLTAKYTEEAIGSGHPTKADTINRLTLVEHKTSGEHSIIHSDDIITKGPVVDIRSKLPAGFVTDGSVDYSTEIQAALTAGGTILFPDGLILGHASVLTVESNTTIKGYGSTLKCIGGTSKTVGGLSATGKSNIVIEGLTYDGNRANRSPGTPVGSAHGLIFANCNGITIRDVTSQNCVADGLMFTYGTITDPLTRTFNVNIYGGRYTNCYRNNVSVVGGVNIKFFGVRFDNATGTSPQSGVDVEGDDALTPNEDVEFYGCKADNNATSGFAIAKYSKRCKVFGGYSESNAVYGVEINASTTTDTIIDGVSVASNTSHGIHNIGGRSKLTNNIIHNNSGIGINQTGTATQSLIQGNTIYSNLAGINAAGTNNIIDNNNVYDNTSTTGWNISIGGSGGRVTNNISLNSLGATGCYGLNVNSATNVTIIGNTVTGAQNNSGVQILGLGNADYSFGNIDGAVTNGLTANRVGTNSGVYSGTGTPEGVVTANIGSIYLRTDGGASTSMYVKESGSGNTGWVAK